MTRQKLVERCKEVLYSAEGGDASSARWPTMGRLARDGSGPLRGLAWLHMADGCLQCSGRPGRPHTGASPRSRRQGRPPRWNEVAFAAREKAVRWARKWKIESTERPVRDAVTSQRCAERFLHSCGPRGWSRRSTPADDTQLLRVSGGRPRPSTISNPGVPLTAAVPAVAHLDHRAHRSRRRLCRGRSRAHDTRPARPAVSWKNGPARAASPPAVNTPLRPIRPTVQAAGNPHSRSTTRIR